MSIHASLKPVKRKKLYEDVVDQLEGMMKSGALAPGDQLPPEREMMEAFGVGRTSIREALFALERNGLVSIRNGERAYVTVPSASALIDEISVGARYLLSREEGMKEFQRARIILECSLVRYAASASTPVDIKRMEAALVRNEAATDAQTFSETDLAFHLQITRVARNEIFNALHQASALWLEEQRSVSLKTSGASASALAFHRRILDAIKQGDPDAAEAAMQEHLTAVAGFYWTEVGVEKDGVRNEVADPGRAARVQSKVRRTGRLSPT
jgi:DNA-binding FadR family transcriptional regulator